jgi:hypothetical protein
VPGEGRDGAVIRAVGLDVHDPLEDPSRESCEGDFIQSFMEEMRGFDDLQRQKSSYVVILLRRSSI